MLSNDCCQGCDKPIKDQYIFQVLPDMQWHENCLKCAECQCQLNATCFMRNSKPYCRLDFSRLFSKSFSPVMKQCDKCLVTLNRHDLIMKSKEKTFHLECFKCSMCAKKLAPGDEYCHLPDENDLILCREDALLAVASPKSSSSPKFESQQNQIATNQLFLGIVIRFNDF